MLFVNALNEALKKTLSASDLVYLLGEDIVDPYGGAFKVTRGLSTAFPGRVMATPISEASIVGMATGMALCGYRPVVEIMFGDFLGLAFDQILNSASKFHDMYHGQVKVPLTIRTPMGGGRSYGPTHSQSLEKFFFGIPGFKVLAPSLYINIEDFIKKAVLNDDCPKLIVEHKLLYPSEMGSLDSLENDEYYTEVIEEDGYPVIGFSLVPPENCHATILAYGYTAELAKKAAYELMMNDEIACQVIVPALLSPFGYELLKKSVSRTGRLFIAEEGTMCNGFGAEISAFMQEAMHGKLRSPIKRVASQDAIVPCARDQETEMLISEQDLRNAVLSVL